MQLLWRDCSTISHKGELTLWLNSHSHSNGFSTGLSGSIDVDGPHAKLVLPVCCEVLDIVVGVGAGCQVLPLLGDGIPDLQVVGLDSAAAVIGWASPLQGEGALGDLRDCGDTSRGIRFV